MFSYFCFYCRSVYDISESDTNDNENNCNTVNTSLSKLNDLTKQSTSSQAICKSTFNNDAICYKNDTLKEVEIFINV